MHRSRCFRSQSRPELLEYLSVVAALLKKTDLFVARLRLFDLECKEILNGAKDEDELVKAITSRMMNVESPGPPSPQK